jgi:hypothetical protein
MKTNRVETKPDTLRTRARRQTTNKCAIPECGKPIPGGMLMCKWHWVRVPNRMRYAVNAAWRAFQLHINRETSERYREARDAAIKSITDNAELRRAAPEDA